MIEVSHTVAVGPDRVYAILADGWLYPLWVVGASHIREVDESWPAVGSRIHHSVGPWPLAVKDVTKVIAVEPARMLELDARVWPAGAARVRLTLQPVGEDETRVTMGAIFDRGPAQQIPTRAQAAVMRPRNVESLRRLADIAEHRDVVCTPRTKAAARRYEDPALGIGIKAQQG